MALSRTEVRQLIAAAREAEPDSVTKLLESYRNYLRILARTCLTSALAPKADGSDLAQDTLLQAHQHFATFRGSTEGELVVWLRQILAQNVAQLVRRFNTAARNVHRERSFEAIFAQSSAALVKLVSCSGITPSQSAERRDMCLVLCEALETLSRDHREVIILRNVEGLQWPEVAARMNRTSDAVRMLWTRALRQLRPLVEA